MASALYPTMKLNANVSAVVRSCNVRWQSRGTYLFIDLVPVSQRDAVGEKILHNLLFQSRCWTFTKGDCNGHSAAMERLKQDHLSLPSSWLKSRFFIRCNLADHKTIIVVGATNKISLSSQVFLLEYLLATRATYTWTFWMTWLTRGHIAPRIVIGWRDKKTERCLWFAITREYVSLGYNACPSVTRRKWLYRELSWLVT